MDPNDGAAMKAGAEAELIPYKAVRQVGRGPVLVLAPHPDDEVLGCGGAIIRHVKNEDSVHVIILTDGRFGDLEIHHREDAQEDHAPRFREYIEIRKQESLSAALILGYGTPQFWDIPDRGLEYGEAIVHRIKDWIEKTDAHFVYAPSLFEIHPDHRALAMIAVETVRRCEENVKLVMYEIGMPLNPNLLLDISDLSGLKQEAARCFVSQLKLHAYDQYMTALNHYRTYTLPQSVTAAEAFYISSARELSANPLQIYSSEFERQKEFGLLMDIKDAPLVTVIIRTIGRKLLVRKALDSVALQTYPNIEVVLVDAVGEEDPQLGQWCGRFPLRICGTARSLSRSKAANIGLENARGEYLIFLDDDDWFEPDHIAGLMKAMRENPDVQVVYSGVRCVDAEGKDKDLFFNHPYDPVRLLAANEIPIHALLFERDLLNHGCRFDEAFDIYEDWDFWIQLSLHTKFFHLNRITAIYRISNREGSGVHGYERARKGREAIYDKWRGLWTRRQVYDLMMYSLKQREAAELRKEIEEKTVFLKDRDAKIAEQAAQHAAQLSERDAKIAEQAAQLSDFGMQLTRIYGSKAYHFYRFLRVPVRFIRGSLPRPNDQDHSS